MSKAAKPKIAERRADICKRVEKCTLLDLEILDQVLEIEEYGRRAKMRNTVCDHDRAMANRWFLLYDALHWPDEEAERVLAILRTLRRGMVNAHKESKPA